MHPILTFKFNANNNDNLSKFYCFKLHFLILRERKSQKLT